MGRSFFTATGTQLTITDGDRNPARQAAEMYQEFQRANGPGVYGTGERASEVKAVYDQVMTDTAPIPAGQREEAAKNAMAAVITRQVANGMPVSRHLVGQGVDVKSAGFTNEQYLHLFFAIREADGMILFEGDHIHVSFEDNHR